MDWARYKALCDTPDVCSRWMLQQTLELLNDGGLQARLERILAQRPLPKPDDHRGGAATDMFRVDLSLEEVRAVRRQVEAARVRGESTSATRGRGLGGFIEAWQEYEAFLEREPTRGGPPVCSRES